MPRHLSRSVAAVLFCLALTFVTLPSAAQQPTWELIRPSNTGIPGEEMRLARFAPDGQLWVAARWLFWNEGGVARRDMATGAWTVLADYETPLPSPWVNDLVFAPGGVVWIGTDSGLARLQDGQWTVYHAGNSPLVHGWIRSLALDPDGHLWINNTSPQSGAAAILEFDGASWRSFSVPDDIPWDDPWRTFSDVHVDAEGHVWVGNQTLNGLAEFDGESWVIHGRDINRFGLINSDQQGDIWVIDGTQGYDVWRFDGTSFIPFGGGTPPLSQTTVTDIAVEPSGDVLIGNWVGEIVRSTDQGATWSPVLTAPGRVVNLAPDPSGNGELWVAMPHNVRHFAADGTQVAAWNTYNTGMPWYFVDGLGLDSQGNMWVSTGEAGVSRFDGLRWRNWGAHNAGSEPWPFLAERCNSIYEAPDGGIWLGSNGVGRWDPVTEELEIWDWRNTGAFTATMYEHVIQDPDGDMMTFDDLGNAYIMTDGQWSWMNTFDPYAPDGYPGVDIDSQGNVWAAAWMSMHVWDGTSWSTVGEEWPFVDLGGMNAMTIGPDDVVWMGTDGGLLRWDGVELQTFTTANSPLPAPEVQSIAVRDDGLVALSSYEFGPLTPYPNGVSVIDGDPADPASWSVYSYGSTPLPHYQLETVAFDAHGDLWITAQSEAVAVLRFDDLTAGPDGAPQAPAARLVSAHPNPFNPQTTIRYRVPAAGEVRLAVHDARGRLVRQLVDGARPAGEHAVSWDGRDEAGRRMPSGVYLLRVVTPAGAATGKVLLAK